MDVEVNSKAKRVLVGRSECCKVWAISRAYAGESKSYVYKLLGLAESTYRDWCDVRKTQYQTYRDIANKVISKYQQDVLPSHSHAQRIVLLSEAFIDQYGSTLTDSVRAMHVSDQQPIVDENDKKLWLVTRVVCGETPQDVCSDDGIDIDWFTKWSLESDYLLYQSEAYKIKGIFLTMRNKYYCPLHLAKQLMRDAFDKWISRGETIKTNPHKCIDDYYSDIDASYRKLWVMLRIIREKSFDTVAEGLGFDIDVLDYYLGEGKNYDVHETHAVVIWKSFTEQVSEKLNENEKEILLRGIFDNYLRGGKASDLVDMYMKKQAKKLAKLKKKEEKCKKKKLSKSDTLRDNSDDEENKRLSKIRRSTVPKAGVDLTKK